MNFVSEYQLDRRAYAHMCENGPKKFFWRTVLASVVFIMCTAELMVMGAYLLCAGLGIGCLGYHIFVLWKREQEYKKIQARNDCRTPRLVTILDEDGIRMKNLNSGKEFSTPAEKLGLVQQSKRFVSVTDVDSSMGHTFDVRAMTEGDGDSLVKCLAAKGCKVEKLHSVRWLQWIVRAACILFIVLGLSFHFSGRTAMEMASVEVPTMDVRTAAAALEELGIGGITEEMILEIEGHEYQPYNAVPTLLSYVGYGDYDEETWEWSPAGNGVYAVDMEFFDVSRMYTDFLRGIEDIGGGELEFTDVTEEHPILLEIGVGLKKVSFTFDGRKHTLRPILLTDWLDLGFPDKIAKLVRRADTGKELYFLMDYDTVFYIFYRDAEWAEEFEAKTGYPLAKKIG